MWAHYREGETDRFGYAYKHVSLGWASGQSEMQRRSREEHSMKRNSLCNGTEESVSEQTWLNLGNCRLFGIW